MKLIHDRKEFDDRTKPIYYHLYLDDIESDTRLGFFLAHRYEELLDYCKKNPQYHVISKIGRYTLTVNNAVKGAVFYMLGEGDPDPELMYCMSSTYKEFEELQIHKFNIDKRSA